MRASFTLVPWALVCFTLVLVKQTQSCPLEQKSRAGGVASEEVAPGMSKLLP